MGQVNGLFDSIVHAFKHITVDVVAKLAPVVGPMFGLPPEALGPLSALLLRAHAGSAEAKAKVERLRQHGGTFRGRPLGPGVLVPALQRINVAVSDHPHFGHMKTHAAKQVEKARGRGGAPPPPRVVGSWR